MKHPVIDACVMCANGEFKKYPNTPSKVPTHFYCTKCNTVYNSSFEFPAFQKYEVISAEAYKRILEADLKHYQRLLKDHFNTKNFFNTEYNNIHAFGGGIPKMEQFFTHKHLHVYDGCAKSYLPIVDMFNTIYKYDRTVDFIDYVFDDTNDFLAFLHSFVDITSKDLITFVNFLEHLHPMLLVKTLAALRTFAESAENKTYIIHVPWMDLNRTSSWVH